MGGYAFGTQPGPLQVTPQGGATDSIDREAIARGEAYEEPKPPVALQPGGLNLLGKQGYQAINEQMAKMREDTTRRLTTNEKGEKIMGPLGEIAANLINPVPGSIPQAGMLVSGPAIGTIARSPLARGVTTGAVDAALGGIEGGSMGALLGGTGGLASGVLAGNVSKLGKPSQAYQAFQKTQKMIKKYGSPEVAGVAGKMQIDEMARSKALREIQGAAGEEIEKTIRFIKQVVPENQPVSVFGLDPRIVAQYNASQTQTAHHIAGIEGVFGQPGITGTFENMDRFKTWLRGRNDPAWKPVIEEMVKTADQQAGRFQGTPAGKAYEAATKYYRANMDMLRFIEGLHQEMAKGVIGGLNPLDYPEAKEISKLALGGKGRMTEGATEVAIGATHPGMFGQYRMLHGLRNMLRGGEVPIRGQFKEPGPLRKGLAETGAGIISATPGVPRLPKKTQETEE